MSPAVIVTPYPRVAWEPYKIRFFKAVAAPPGACFSVSGP